ncbi:MAG TPA: hypothetical protein VJ476_14380, partial [Rhizomicrobium sp.]|nr:hypothetical protein [Rhizomicrobium sp.]
MRASGFGLLLALIAATPALADPPCKLGWNLDSERSLLQGRRPRVDSGTLFDAVPGTAITLNLKPGAVLPHASAKPADPAKSAGFVTVRAPRAGDYYVSLSGEAWIDVVQGNALVASTAHTGDPDCPGLRKSVRFTLSASPLTVEISNAP